uniref:Uncharacterized protein n=1 Tax=Thermosphaera aggregans TaxID=54254 RepID=A0A7C2BJS9_9CREN
MVFTNHNLRTELKIVDSQLIFHCDPENFYLTSFPVSFDSTLWEIIDTLSILARFISIHQIGRLAIVYEKRSPRNTRVIKILNKLRNARKFDLPTVSDKVNVAILLADLLETSEKIRAIRRDYSGRENYDEYQLELEKLSKVLRAVEEFFGPEFAEFLEIIDEAVEEPEVGLSGEEIIKELIREKTGDNGWGAATLFITPSDLNIDMGIDVISRVSAVIDKLGKNHVELFVYIPFKYSFLRSYITSTNRFIILQPAQ